MTLPSYPSHTSVPVKGGVPPGLHCAVKRFCSGVNGQASQLSPRVFLQPDAAVVQHSFAGVWKFTHLLESGSSLLKTLCSQTLLLYNTLVLLSGSSLLGSLCGMT